MELLRFQRFRTFLDDEHCGASWDTPLVGGDLSRERLSNDPVRLTSVRHFVAGALGREPRRARESLCLTLPGRLVV